MGASKNRKRIQNFQDIINCGRGAKMCYKKWASNRIYNVIPKQIYQRYKEIEVFLELVLIPQFISFLGTGFFLFDENVNSSEYPVRLQNAMNALVEPEPLEQTDQDDLYLLSWSISIVNILEDEINKINDLYTQKEKELAQCNKELTKNCKELKKHKFKTFTFTYKDWIKEKNYFDDTLTDYIAMIKSRFNEDLIELCLQSSTKSRNLEPSAIHKDHQDYILSKCRYIDQDKCKKIIEIVPNQITADILKNYKELNDKINENREKYKTLSIIIKNNREKHRLMKNCCYHQQVFQEKFSFTLLDIPTSYFDTDRGLKIAEQHLFSLKKELSIERLKNEIQLIVNSK
jgi:hypothetical protein